MGQNTEKKETAGRVKDQRDLMEESWVPSFSVWAWNGYSILWVSVYSPEKWGHDHTHPWKMGEFTDEKKKFQKTFWMVNIHQKLAAWGKKSDGAGSKGSCLYFGDSIAPLWCHQSIRVHILNYSQMVHDSFQKRVGGLAESQETQPIKALEKNFISIKLAGRQRTSAWWVQSTTVCKFRDGIWKTSSCKSLETLCI